MSDFETDLSEFLRLEPLSPRNILGYVKYLESENAKLNADRDAERALRVELERENEELNNDVIHMAREVTRLSREVRGLQNILGIF